MEKLFLRFNFNDIFLANVEEIENRKNEKIFSSEILPT